MDAPPLITLTTDFGVGSAYVAAMKGVIYSICPAARIVDLTHAVPPQDVAAGARALADVAPLFPPGTIHVAVIDPGVGTERSIVYAEIAGQRLICPDNGLLTLLAAREKPRKIRAITERRWMRAEVSATFHGRDVMAPAAAHLAAGLDPEQLGPPHGDLVTLAFPGAEKVANSISGEVVSIDSFGNLVTNIKREMLEGVPTDDSVAITCDEHETRGIFTTYGDQPDLTLIALIGSTDALELAIVGESAAIMLGVRAGTPVTVAW
ncbi:MAG: hypothetical protein CMJ58_07365 [Planctomycetaceae bacterium]|nr:hypothetical protein [Planctomycetaceae bacterium]